MDFITLYESASTDGYSTQGDGRYFLSRIEAEQENKELGHGGHGRVIEHKNCIYVEGKYYSLTNRNGICLAKPREEEETIRKNALAKLTAEEQRLLGIK